MTFDAFDTLVTRPVHEPSDVFLLCGYRMAQAGLISIDPAAWRDLRCRAEDELRRSAGGAEITIEAIFRRAALLVGDPGFDGEAAMELEMEVEILLSRPIAETARCLREHDGRAVTAILSDTYFPLETLHAILRPCGIDFERTAVIASCVAGQTKRSGSLFGWYRKSLGREGGKHLHIGDHLYSDGRQARRAGCSIMPYHEGTANRAERAVGGGAIEPPILRSALAGSMRSARLRTPVANDHERGVVDVASGLCGPLLVAYVAWILKRARELDLDRLYFFAREGEILIQVARRLAEANGLELELRYLYVSRQSLHLPALDRLSDDDISSMNIRLPISASRIFAKLELAPQEDLREALVQNGYHGPTDSSELSETDLRELLAALRSPAILPRLVEASALRRSALIDYLRQERVFDQGSIGFVDIGWNGRLQRSIVAAARTVDPTMDERVHGFYFSLFSRPTRSAVLEAYTERPEGAQLLPYIRSALFEAFCAAGHGTTRYYRRDPDGLVRPVLESEKNPAADAWGLELQQAAIVAFTDDLVATARLAGLDLIEHQAALGKAALIALQTITATPSRREAEALGSFPHPADEPSHGSDQIAPAFPLSPAEWMQRWSRRRHHPLISDWPEGSIMRSVPRPVGLAVIRLVHRIARLRNARRAVKTG